MQAELGKADVLVFQRNVMVPEVWAAMDYWRAIGKAVAVDLDDDYPQLPPSNPAHNYWQRNRGGLDPEPVEALKAGMGHADALTSPSKVILEDWAHIIPGYWLPNWTRRAWYEKATPKPPGAPDIIFEYRPTSEGQPPELSLRQRENSEGWCVIGWGGSISHVDSWLYSGIVGALDRLFEKHPHLRLKFCGNEQRLDTWLNRWGERVIRQGGVRAEHWPGVVGTFDIGVAPLDLRKLDPWREGGPVASYDERRSWLKGVEYLSAGVPWVGSASLTYDDLARHGTLVESTPEAWFKALDHKITHLAAEKQLAQEKRRWALKRYTMEANVARYGEILGRVIAEKSVKAGARLPGITYVQQVAARQ